jgi:DNA-directed RNA polymerase specialized sigma24 family protein
MPDDDFTALVTRVRSGDTDALDEILTRYGAPIRRAARALIGRALQPHLDSMDLYQSVHFTLLLGLQKGKFDIATPEQFIALATTLLRRKAARHWRHLQKDPGAGSSQAVLDATHAATIVAGWGSDPADVLPQTEEVRRLLDSLDQIDRRLLELRLAGHSTVSAAHIMGMDPAILRVRLGRLRHYLRDQGLLNGMV